MTSVWAAVRQPSISHYLRNLENTKHRFWAKRFWARQRHDGARPNWQLSHKSAACYYYCKREAKTFQLNYSDPARLAGDLRYWSFLQVITVTIREVQKGPKGEYLAILPRWTTLQRLYMNKTYLVVTLICSSVRIQQEAPAGSRSSGGFNISAQLIPRVPHCRLCFPVRHKHGCPVCVCLCGNTN